MMVISAFTVTAATLFISATILETVTADRFWMNYNKSEAEELFYKGKYTIIYKYIRYIYPVLRVLTSSNSSDNYK